MMKIVYKTLLVGATLAVLSQAPLVWGQEEEAASSSTWWDALGSSSEHTAFVTALLQANVPARLNDGSTEFTTDSNVTQQYLTVLAPSNQAVAALGEDTVARLLGADWVAHLNDLLLYHLVPGDFSDPFSLSDTINVTTLQGINVTLNKQDFDTTESGATMSIDTENGRILFANRVFLPVSMTESVPTKLFNDTQFSILYELVKSSSTDKELRKVQGPVTVFAPTDRAWLSLDPDMLASLRHPNYKAELLQILAAHFIWDENVFSSDMTDGAQLSTMLEGESLTVNTTATNSTDSIIILNGNTTITQRDVLVTNGVVHVIDQVILPTGFEIKPRSAQHRTAKNYDYEPDKRLTVVAMGDSFIAGNGARGPNGLRNYEDTVCYRSDSSWAGLYAQCVEDSSLKDSAVEVFDVYFINRACSAAMLDDLYDKQLGGVTKSVDLVLLSIGGNDVGFIEAVKQCLILLDPVDCATIIADSRHKMELFQERIAQLMVDIRERGHDGTKVVLVGTPYMSLDVEYNLQDTNPLPPHVDDYPVVQEIRAAGDALDVMQKGAVEKANQLAGQEFAVFESIHELMNGREFDPRPDQSNPARLVRGLEPEETFGFPPENYHYTAEGHAVVGNHLCTRGDYGAGQPVTISHGNGPKQGWSTVMFTFLALTLTLFFGALFFQRKCVLESEYTEKCSQKWSATVLSFQHPIRSALIAISRHAASNPRTCLAFGFFLAISMFIAGYTTNFNVVSDEYRLSTPLGGRSEADGKWVGSWFSGTSGGGKNGDGSGDNVLLTLLVHKNGENVLSKDGITALFEVLDTVRNSTGYHDFCAMYGTDKTCPTGYEYICQLYGVPTASELPSNCRIVGPTGFFFHNRTVFDEQVTSDQEAAEAMSLDIFLGSKEGEFHIDDVFGYPEYKNGVIVSSTSFVSLISFPKESANVEPLRINIVENLLKLQKNWSSEYHLEFFTTGSFEDEFNRSIEEDIILVPFVFIGVCIFTVIVFSKRNWVESQSLLGFGAVLTILLSLTTGYGLLFCIGVPLTSVTQTLPFVLFGIGLDDSFLLFNAYERTDSTKSSIDRLEDAIEEVGISMFLTTATSSLAFALGSLSSIPAARWLCLYAFPTILIDYGYQITFFPSLIILDEQRKAALRRDCFVCLKKKRSSEELRLNSDDPKKLCGIQRCLSIYANCLLRPISKGVVLLLFLSLYVICAFFAAQQKIDFDAVQILPSDSYVRSFALALDEFSQRRLSIYVYFRDVDQSNAIVQDQMVSFVNDLVINVKAIAEPPLHFWIKDFQSFSADQGSGMPFNETLQKFLEDPRFQYNGSIILDDQGNIFASRTQIRLGNVDPSSGADAIVALRELYDTAAEQTINYSQERPAFFTYTSTYNLWESAIASESELKLTTFIGISCVSVMTLIFLPHWSAVLFVLPFAVFLYIDLLGIFQLTDIDINGVSFVAIVMAIGLYVDYLLHVLLSYFASNEVGRNAKVKTALETVGRSVLLGGLSTFFGAIPLALTSSDIFYSVFVAFIAIVTLGLGHGLIFLPVVLSLVGPEGFPTNCDRDSPAPPVLSQSEEDHEVEESKNGV